MQVTLIRLDTSTQETIETQIDIEDRVFFGRQIDSPLTLQGEALSRQHFALFMAEEQLMIENLSINGTSLNKEALAIKNPVSVQSGDVVEVPNYQIRLELRGALPNDGTEEAKLHGWQSYGKMALGFFDPLEITLLLCAIACIFLITYYIFT